jgi:anaerobic selenocysteine-containing dehydrogenase
LPEKGLVAAGDRLYTHLLVSRRTNHFYNSSSHYVEALQKYGVTNYAHMNPADLSKLRVESDSLILIEAENDSIVGVALADEKIKPGVISMAHCFGDIDSNKDNVRRQGSSTNKIIMTDKYFDPITGMTRLSAIPVNIIPLGD